MPKTLNKHIKKISFVKETQAMIFKQDYHPNKQEHHESIDYIKKIITTARTYINISSILYQDHKQE